MKDYNSMVVEIKNIEQSNATADLTSENSVESVIDLNMIISGPTATNKPKAYKELLSTITRVEKRQAGMKYEKPEKAILIKQTETAKQKVNLEAPQSSLPIVKQPPQPIQINMPHISFPSDRIKSELSEVSKTLSALNLPKREQREPKEQKQKPNDYEKLKAVAISKRIMKNSILPNLSVADQISELEKIIEGLKEGAFDKQHLEIVKREVNDLNEILKIERMESENVQEDPMEGLRYLRLSDIMALLSDAEVE